MVRNFKSSLWMLCLIFIFQAGHAQIFFNEETFKFGKVLHLISQYYVDSVNEKKLVEKAIVQMLKDLDPHSAYIPAEEVKEMNEPLEGNFEGIGVTFNILDDTIYIISPISGGPSEKVGIMAGDRIVQIENENVAGIGISNKTVRSKLLGTKGTKVKVGIRRRGVPEMLEFVITRDKIPIYSMDAFYMVNDSTGYIKFNRFAKTTLDEFNVALDSLKKQNCKNLIVDLTGNGGGYLEIAVKLIDQFLGRNKLVVYTKGVNAPKYEYVSTGSGGFISGRLIILIDEGTASASEIMSGAIQDWDRGLIIGRRSFGKGLVQRPFDLPDSSQIRLTISRYYTPSGRCIQKPYEKGYDDYAADIAKRYEHGEFSNVDSIKLPDSLKYYTLVRKRTVYGGGGIMPDIFVPFDTTYITGYYRNLLAKGILNRFALNYVDENRKKILKAYPTFKQFETNFTVDDNILASLIKAGTTGKVAFNEKEYAISKDQIALLIKAYIARDIWDSSEFYRLLNTTNPLYLKAVEVMNNPDIYNQKLGIK